MARLIEDVENEIIIEEDFSDEIKVGSQKGSIIYLGHDNKRYGINRQYYLKCLKLAEDKELYRDGTFLVDRKVVKRMSLEKGRRNFHKWQFEILIKRKCLEKDYKFLGFVDNPDKIFSSTKLQLECHCGYKWDTTSVSKLLDCNRGCPKCAGNIPWTKEKFLRELTKFTEISTIIV